MPMIKTWTGHESHYYKKVILNLNPNLSFCYPTGMEI